jgi:hypothetical protein
VNLVQFFPLWSTLIYLNIIFKNHATLLLSNPVKKLLLDEYKCKVWRTKQMVIMFWINGFSLKVIKLPFMLTFWEHFLDICFTEINTVQYHAWLIGTNKTAINRKIHSQQINIPRNENHKLSNSSVSCSATSTHIIHSSESKYTHPYLCIQVLNWHMTECNLWQIYLELLVVLETTRVLVWASCPWQ